MQRVAPTLGSAWDLSPSEGTTEVPFVSWLLGHVPWVEWQAKLMALFKFYSITSLGSPSIYKCIQLVRTYVAFTLLWFSFMKDNIDIFRKDRTCLFAFHFIYFYPYCLVLYQSLPIYGLFIPMMSSYNFQGRKGARTWTTRDCIFVNLFLLTSHATNNSGDFKFSLTAAILPFSFITLVFQNLSAHHFLFQIICFTFLMMCCFDKIVVAWRKSFKTFHEHILLVMFIFLSFCS